MSFIWASFLLTFKIIIDTYILIAILLIVLICSCSLLLTSSIVTVFSIIFGFISLYFLCIYHRFSVVVTLKFVELFCFDRTVTSQNLLLTKNICTTIFFFHSFSIFKETPLHLATKHTTTRGHPEAVLCSVLNNGKLKRWQGPG